MMHNELLHCGGREIGKYINQVHAIKINKCSGTTFREENKFSLSSAYVHPNKALKTTSKKDMINNP